jgi:hypothetical protein
MIKTLRLHAIQLKSLMSKPQRLFSHQLAFRTISDSDEEEYDFGGRPLKEWEFEANHFNWLEPVLQSLDDEQSQLLCYLFLNKREKNQARKSQGKKLAPPTSRPHRIRPDPEVELSKFDETKDKAFKVD